MEHDDAMVGRILSRRQAISVAAQAGFALALGGMLSRRAWLSQRRPMRRKSTCSPAPR